MHVIDVARDITQINAKIAERNRKTLDAHKVFSVEILGAIGSGKTTLVEKLVGKLGAELSTAVIVGDVISDADTNRLKKLGVPLIGLNTGKECHLDAHLIEHALEKLPLEKLDLLIIENVGNLICPVDFPLGSHRRIVMVSVSEGNYTVEKHPMIFLEGDIMLINKVDIADAVDVSVEKLVADAKKIKPHLRVIETSLKNGGGLPEIISWIRKEGGI
jgi:hydrogenase nickel incorporation protein HypB